MSIAARRSHRGDEYQIAVAAYWSARLLSDGMVESVRVDAVALPGETELVQVDDIVVSYVDGTWRFIQAKKNQTDHKEWRLTDAVLRHELCKARDQLESTPDTRVELCSRTPFGDLAKLIEDGADFPDYSAFAAHAPETLKQPLARLSAILERQEAAVLAMLRRIDIGPHHDYEGWEALTRAQLETRVTDVETALDVINRLVRSQQSGLKARGDALPRADLLAALEARGVLPTPAGSAAEDAAAFAAASRLGRDWRRTIGGEPIPAPAAAMADGSGRRLRVGEHLADRRAGDRQDLSAAGLRRCGGTAPGLVPAVHQGRVVRRLCEGGGSDRERVAR